MDIHINDEAFIDLINDEVRDDIVNLETAVEDLESELGDKTTEEYVDDIAVDLRNEWSNDIDNMREQIESNTPALALDSLEDEVNEIQRELIAADNYWTDAVTELRQQIREQNMRINALENTFFKRTYRKLMDLSRKINWYSPRI